MQDSHPSPHLFENPTEALEAAIGKLESFTQPEAGCIEIHEDGRLIATKSSALNRVKHLARHFIVPLFSEQALYQREKKLNRIKEEVLHARDILQSHANLIEKLRKGDVNQQKLAHSALEAIKKYNAVVENDYYSWTTRYDFNNFERNQILLDNEIKGQKIELPNVVSINFESHTPSQPVQQSFKDLGQAFLKNASGTCAGLNPKPKKTAQFMTDTFRMKAVRMIQSHLTHPQSMAEIVHLIRQTPIEIEEEDPENANLILMRQVVEEAPGFRIILTGSFKRLTTDLKFMSIPILESFHLASHVSHAGFPYPSQHTGWSLSESLVQAYPLRSDQSPLFQQIEQRRKHLTQCLLFNRFYSQKSQTLFQLKKEVFDQNRESFLVYHQTLQESILRAAEMYSEEAGNVLTAFYQLVQSLSSPYDIINYAQQKLNNLLMKDPAQVLEEEWLNVKGSLLRKGNPQEKLQVASKLLQKEIEHALSSLDLSRPIDAYLHLMGKVLSAGGSGIILQYFSEKVGFVPPMLNDYQQKIQTCAFFQLISFLDDFKDGETFSFTSETIKSRMAAAFKKDTQIFRAETIEEIDHLASKIVQELEVYFPTRHFARYPRKSYIPETIL